MDTKISIDVLNDVGLVLSCAGVLVKKTMIGPLASMIIAIVEDFDVGIARSRYSQLVGEEWRSQLCGPFPSALAGGG